MAGRRLRKLALADDEQSELEGLARRPKSAQAFALRAKIVFKCAGGSMKIEVADKLGISFETVRKWREHFRQNRMQGLSDAPRSGPPRKIGDDRVEEISAKTLTSRLKGDMHWSTRKMAAETGLSQATISRMWRTFGLQPHRSESFKLLTDPLFIEKTRDVFGLYFSPSENAIVFCVDDKSQVKALDRMQPIFPMRSGVPERQTHDYLRHGVTSLFAALNVNAGQIIDACHRRYRHQEFLRFLRRIDRKTPTHVGIHLVLDNYATHKLPPVQRWFLEHPRFSVHFTPTSSSWLNQVERFSAGITRCRIRRRILASVAGLERAIGDYLDDHNSVARPYVWTATADLMFAELSKYNSANSDSEH